ncbi:hypothetical protein QZH41_009187 [Actinostola sp. cb2023]|nr:hypothetical protein QZH41_009187 [Actinostola sp. cb2023]
MSIIGEFELRDQGCSETSTLDIDNTQSFTLGLTDFEQYCTQTDIDSKPIIIKREPGTQNNGVESCKNSDLLDAEELSETLERELTPTSSWLDSSVHVSNEEFESALTLSPRLYSSGKGQTVAHTETNRENDKFQMIKDPTLSYCSQNNNSWTATTSWTNDQLQETACLRYEKAKRSPFKVVGDSEQGIISTSVIESGQQIPSSWMATTDHETSTHAFSEVMAIPQIYSNAQPHPIRVELGNDGQQYMIVDSKYLSQNTEDTIPLQVGGNNPYFLAGMPMQHLGGYPVATLSSDSQSASTSSSLSSRQETRATTPFEAFEGYTEEDMIVDESVMEEQKRKEVMQMRRREKNKDCSRAFRRKLKEKERTLRESRMVKQCHLQDLNRKNEKLLRMFSKAALQGCEKAKCIASAGMQTWNKENKAQRFVNHCNM